jgi:Alpha/beta hydrolase domain
VPHDLRVISYETIVAGARRHFLRLGTIDMDELAHEFCLLFGTHVPFSDAQLSSLYRNHGSYVSSVRAVDRGNEDAGFLLHADALENLREAAQSDVGKR